MSASRQALSPLAAATACILLFASSAQAQRRVVEPPPGPDILTRADFHLGATLLGSADERFAWDTHWGGEFDLVDYVRGRVTFFGDYQAILGHELQPFDPNQGNYTLTMSSSLRLDVAELSVVFNHVSRHLGDRAKAFGIAMNVLGVRGLREFAVGDMTIDLRVDAGRVIQNAYIDYAWIVGADLRARQRISPRVVVYAHANGERFGVDPSVAGRTDQQGGSVETGIRLQGRGGAVEFFIGYARVVDADPIDRQARRWALAGFRLLTP